MAWLNLVGLALLARICLVALFPFSALDKILHWRRAMQQLRVPSRAAGASMLCAAIAIELVTPACIVIGWHDRLAAFVLAGFCVVTAPLYHPFWKFSDFWTGGVSKGRGHLWDFLKTFGLIGGLLLAVIITDFAPLTALLDDPLSSTPRAAAPVEVLCGSAMKNRLEHSSLRQHPPRFVPISTQTQRPSRQDGDGRDDAEANARRTI